MERIITISREYGSGGRLIGKLLAKKLELPFYDKELIAMVAEQSGFAMDYVEETGEYSPASSRLFNIAVGSMYRQGAMADDLPQADKIHIVQNKVINEIADMGPCVIIGRSADYILRERENCLNVFVHAKMVDKRARAINYYGIEPDRVEKALKKRDKARASHYRYYTDQVWGMASNYHLSLDSGLFGIEGCVDLIASVARD